MYIACVLFGRPADGAMSIERPNESESGTDSRRVDGDRSTTLGTVAKIATVVGPATAITGTVYLWGYQYEGGRARTYGLTPEFFNRSARDYILSGIPIATAVLVVAVLVGLILVIADGLFLQKGTILGRQVVRYTAIVLVGAATALLLLGAADQDYLDVTINSLQFDGPTLSIVALQCAVMASLLAALGFRVAKSHVVQVVLLLITIAALNLLPYLLLRPTSVWQAICSADCAGFDARVSGSFLTIMLATALGIGTLKLLFRRTWHQSCRNGSVLLLVVAAVVLVVSVITVLIDLGAPSAVTPLQLSDSTPRVARLVLAVGLLWISLWITRRWIDVSGPLGRPFGPIARLDRTVPHVLRWVQAGLLVLVACGTFYLVAQIVELRGQSAAVLQRVAGLSSVRLASTEPLSMDIPGVRMIERGAESGTKYFEYLGFQLLYRNADSYLLFAGPYSGDVFRINDGDAAEAAVGELLGGATVSVKESSTLSVIVSTLDTTPLEYEVDSLGDLSLVNIDGESVLSLKVGVTTLDEVRGIGTQWTGPDLEELDTGCPVDDVYVLSNSQLRVSFQKDDPSAPLNGWVLQLSGVSAASWDPLLFGTSIEAQVPPSVPSLEPGNDTPTSVYPPEQPTSYITEDGVELTFDGFFITAGEVGC